MIENKQSGSIGIPTGPFWIRYFDPQKASTEMIIKNPTIFDSLGIKSMAEYQTNLGLPEQIQEK